jgi:hypothetical protein
LGTETGNLYGTVVDNERSPMPGVAVKLTGPEETRVEISNALGKFRFINIIPGAYKPRVEIEGFSMIEYPSIIIHPGRNTQIEVTLNPAPREPASEEEE